LDGGGGFRGGGGGRRGKCKTPPAFCTETLLAFCAETLLASGAETLPTVGADAPLAFGTDVSPTLCAESGVGAAAAPSANASDCYFHEKDRETCASSSLTVLLVQQRNKSGQAADDDWDPCGRDRRQELRFTHVLRDLRQYEQKEPCGDAA